MYIKWDSLTGTQQNIMTVAKHGNPFTIGSWEEDRLRQAHELAEAGLLRYDGPDRFNTRAHVFWITLQGQALIQDHEAPLPVPGPDMPFNAFAIQQQLRITCALVTHLYERSRQLMIELEHERGGGDNYGTTVMTGQDRLVNRIVASLVITSLGIPQHDAEALTWLQTVLNTPQEQPR